MCSRLYIRTRLLIAWDKLFVHSLRSRTYSQQNHSNGPLAALKKKIDSGELVSDEHQTSACEALEDLYNQLKAPDGQIVNVAYTADENGFRATGDHIPTPPPVPDEIQKGLDQIYAGIKLQQERQAERAKSDPDFAKKLEERARANQNGQYFIE